ncbi:MAG: hypothetical protein ACFFD6_03205 [Candidatus Thorarchaeota archaeon]
MQTLDIEILTAILLIIGTWFITLIFGSISMIIALRRMEHWDDLDSKQQVSVLGASGLGCYPCILIGLLMVAVFPWLADTLISLGVPILIFWAIGAMVFSAVGGALPVRWQRRRANIRNSKSE